MRRAKVFLNCTLIMLPYLVCTTASAGEDTAKRKARAQSHLIEARRLASDYKIGKAAASAREALKDNPNLAEAYVYLGLEYFRSGNLKAAKDEFSRALDLDSYEAEAHCQMGFVLYQQGEFESAVDHWNLSARIDPTSPQTIAGVALGQFKNGQEDAAIKTFEKILLYDHRFANPAFVSSDNGPKWSGALLQDFHALQEKAISQAH